jgi:hypothetical protein
MQMRSAQDALYNWLTIKIVYDARPEDSAAKETVEIFDDALKNEYQISNIEITMDERMYYLSYQHEGEDKKLRFPRELIEMTLNQINQNPDRYPNYPLED